MKWTSELYQLPAGHGWTAAPGNKILVLDRGAVLLEYPAAWVVEPGRREFRIRDGACAEDSTCVLAVSFLRLPAVDWSGLPLARLLRDTAEGDDRDRISIAPVIEMTRDGLTIAWTELRVVDPGEHRECRSRLCLARADSLQSLITFDFWPEDEARMAPVWERVLSSLRLGVRLEDPTKGRRIG
ncbi:MAG: hypothetical protein HY337_08520 [Gemmatimonadetes bacterium]|nr:hypothetical protein [Gemmatimonadota bacterium]